MTNLNPEEYQLVCCAKCIINFCVPIELYRRRKEDLGQLYCPVGHRLVFTKKEETNEVNSVSYWRTEALHFEGKAKKLEEQLENEGD